MSLALIQEKLVALLQADPELSGIEILWEKKGDIESQIEQSLAKLNLAVIVLPPVAESIESKADAVALRVRLSVSVVENVTLNDTGKKALEIANRLMTPKVVHGINNGIGNSRSQLSEFRLSSNAMDPVPTPQASMVAYNINFETLLTLR